jgi:protein phosphatase 2C
MKMTGNLRTSLSSTKLTEDHRPDGDDERARIEAAGGSVVNVWGVPLINGILPMSRAIGNVYLKR